MSKKSPESKEITGVRLAPDMKAELTRIAAEMDRPVSWVIRHAVGEWLKAQSKPGRAGRAKTPEPGSGYQF